MVSYALRIWTDLVTAFCAAFILSHPRVPDKNHNETQSLVQRFIMGKHG